MNVTSNEIIEFYNFTTDFITNFNSTDSTTFDTIYTAAPTIIPLNSSNATKLLFNGDNQTRQGLGINVGPIDSLMLQWVFINKFKHAREFRPVCTPNNWVNYSWAGALPTDWSADGYPIRLNISSWSK